jgi:Ca-activated chloride channel family protein
MEVTDVQPSRLSRARQEIEDLINRNREVRIGLIAFASVAHVVAPITEDGQTVRNLLPSISSDLVRLQGSRLGQALERARVLFAGQPKKSQHSILLISDGDFADRDLERQVKSMAADGVRLHVLGVGTTEGGPVPGHNTQFLKDSRRRTIVSRLDEDGLKQIAELGGGVYLNADYRDDDTTTILELAASRNTAQAAEDEQVRVWNERFYWLVIPVLLLLLPMFRQHLHMQTRGQEE